MKKFISLLVALVAMNGAMAQWFPQNSGTTSNLNSVYFTDADRGYAVGDSGIILKSIDGGNNWAIQSSGTFANLFSVQFTDSLTGYAVGDSSIILKTIDGGDNWVNQSVGVSADFSSVSFPTVDTGYVVGFYWDWLNSDTLYNYILKTTNGGNLWTTSYVYKTTDDVGEPYVKSVFFPDVNTGYAVGAIGSMMYYPYLVKTIDGGMNWTSQAMWNFMYYGILSSHFLNADTGYVVGYGGYSSLKTINGGNDWTGLFSFDFSTHYSVYFIDSERGYLVGGQSWSNGNIIQYTEDGGNVWTTQYSDNLPGNYLLSVNFANDTTGYAVGTNGIILKTTNGVGSSVCLPQGITFTNQGQIINFHNNYPDCTVIEGNVTIEGSDISDLNGLSVLTSIGGSLTVKNTNLTNFTGLSNLTSIGNGITITNNNNLVNFSGLEGLIYIGGTQYLQVDYNESLTSFTGLGSLTTIGVVSVNSNSALTNFTGLENLTSIGNNLTIGSNESLISLTGLENLTSIGNNLTIVGNEALVSLVGLEDLTHIDGYLHIESNDSLNNMEGLSNLVSIGGDMLLIKNFFLTNLNGLSNLSTIGGNLYLKQNHNMTDFSGLIALTAVDGGITIFHHNKLTSLNGLENLTTAGNISIYYNNKLTNLEGLANIDAGSINYLTISNNALLATCDIISICNYLASPADSVNIHDNAPGCNSREEVEAACEQHCLPEGITFTTQEQIDNFQINYPGCTEIEGNVVIEGNSISNLNGLSVLDSIGGSLEILYNLALTNLAGLENVTSIGGDLRVWGNAALTSMTGLESLTYIGGDLGIFINDSLTSLTGLENLDSIGGNLEIGGYYYSSGNVSLSSLAGLNNLISIGGSLFIRYNPELSDLSALENLNFIPDNLTITGNYSLTNCAIQNICNYLNAPNGVVEIHNNGSGCNSQSEVVNACGGSVPCLPYGNYYLLSQADVDNFQINFPACNDLAGNLTITGNSIVNLTGLNQVYSIGGSASINYCDNLENLNGLENLYTIGGSFSLHDNHRVKDFSGLENLDSIGALVIGWTDDGGSGGPIPGGNDSLVSLSSLSNLTYVRGIEIGQNPSLLSLAGLDNINANTLAYMAIGLNSSLSTCDVQSICAYLAAPNATVWIFDNAPGCNSPEEVEAACEQHCLPEGITFTTQEQIDNFQINYPGCTEIEGDVLIKGNDITSLNGLNILTSIGGYLILGKYGGNPALNSLTGLDNLISIGGDLKMYFNNALISLAGLENLTSIGGNFGIYSNNSLTSLTGLENLVSIGGNLNIGGQDFGNASLTSLTGLDNLISIGGNLFIRDNPELSDLTALESLTFIPGDLIIIGNDSLTDCAIQNICDYLNAPNGVVEILYNGAGCNSQSEVVNACGGSVPCLPFGNYYFLSQADVDNFQENFPACNDLVGNLTITGNSIVNLTGLNQVYSIGGSVSINYCDNLENLNGLENLHSVGGSFGLGYENHRIKNFSGLENLDSIGGSLLIGSFDDGGPGYLPTGNDSLTSISSLVNLSHVGAGIEIGKNPSLSSLAGLENINASTLTGMVIILNSSLSTCEVQSICDYLASPNSNIDIWGNAPGCNSPEEVIEACPTLVEGVNSETNIRIIPNPARDMITVLLPMLTGKAQLTLFNMTGEKLMEKQITQPETQVDISMLPKGMYFLRLQYENDVKAAKIIKD
ncbi:MAG: T9SS type A sorting domain-containing protein [Bacteroidales bacterium]|nr:T9SS type A sorting domain-containing protein [Bacteroidales bacterium]